MNSVRTHNVSGEPLIAHVVVNPTTLRSRPRRDRGIDPSQKRTVTLYRVFSIGLVKLLLKFQ